RSHGSRRIAGRWQYAGRTSHGCRTCRPRGGAYGTVAARRQCTKHNHHGDEYAFCRTRLIKAADYIKHIMTLKDSDHSISPDDILAFWRAAGPSQWFKKDTAFDVDFRNRFMELHLAAARRELDDWQRNGDGGLALLILLDQFPRNAFRDTAHMFAT